MSTNQAREGGTIYARATRWLEWVIRDPWAHPPSSARRFTRNLAMIHQDQTDIQDERIDILNERLALLIARVAELENAR
jgi:hypothetical protein